MVARRTAQPSPEIFPRTKDPSRHDGRPDRTEKSFRSPTGLESAACPRETQPTQCRIHFRRDRGRARQNRYRTFAGDKFSRRLSRSERFDCRTETLAPREEDVDLGWKIAKEI